MTRAAWITAYMALVLAFAAAAFSRPLPGWDLLGYAGAVIAFDTHDAHRVQADAYRELRAATPPSEYGQLAGDAPSDATAYRHDVAHNAEHFMQQLPFYRVRPLFLGIVFALHKAGLSVERSIYLVSALAYVGLGILVFAWAQCYLPVPFAAGAGLLLLLTSAITGIARAPSPDALSTVILVSAFYALLGRGRPLWFSLLMLLAIFVRNDNAIFASALFLYFGFIDRDSRWSTLRAFGLALLAAGAYFAINEWAGTYGWTVLFHHTFLGFLTEPAAFHGTVLPAQYIAVLKRGLYGVLYSSVPLFGMLWVVAFGLRRRAPLLQDLLVLIVATVAARYLLFPILWDRLLAPYYVLIVMLLIAKAAAPLGHVSPAPAAVLTRRMS